MGPSTLHPPDHGVVPERSHPLPGRHPWITRRRLGRQPDQRVDRSHRRHHVDDRQPAPRAFDSSRPRVAREAGRQLGCRLPGSRASQGTRRLRPLRQEAQCHLRCLRRWRDRKGTRACARPVHRTEGRRYRRCRRDTQQGDDLTHQGTHPGPATLADRRTIPTRTGHRP